MANDSLSIRNTPRLERPASAVDVGQLVAKNQAVKGGSALDGLFATSAEGSFSKVLDSQVNREPSVAPRAPERQDPPASDKAGRSSGKDSPRDRGEFRADARRVDDAASKKRPDTPEHKRADADGADAASGTRANKHKPAHKSEKSKSSDESAANGNSDQAAASQELTAKEQKPLTEASTASAETAVAADTVADSGEGETTDVLALTQQRLAALQLANASGVASDTDVLAAASAAQALNAAAGVPAGEGAGKTGVANAAGVDSALLASMEAANGDAEADPALKDLMNAMMSAGAAAASESGNVVQASDDATSEDALAALARQLNASATRAAVTTGDMASQVSSVEAPVDGVDQLAQAVGMTGLAMGEESVDGTVLAGEGEQTVVTDTAAELLGAEEGEAAGEQAVGTEPKSKTAADKAIPVMTTAAQTAGADVAKSESWSILDKMADALPKNMPKETAETLKNITPQVQSEQQMAMVRDELRSLQRFVDSGLQSSSRITRDASGDDKGLEVKTANLSRAIENLTGSVKATELRAPVTVSNTPVAFGRAGFAEQMAEKIMLMTTQKVQSAEIRMDPKELGAVEVKIRMHQDQASIVFSSPHAQVRDALESTIPRLREMFAESGLGLGNVNVNDRGGSSAGGNEQSQGQGGNGSYGSNDEIVEERPQRLPRQPNGLVDFYA